MCYIWFIICFLYVPKHLSPVELLPIIKIFQNNAHQKVESEVNLLYFSLEDKDKLAGVCRFLNSFNIVEINKYYWNKVDQYGQEQLVLHELGHCELNYEHDDTKIGLSPNERPKSIMYSVAFGHEYVYYKYHDEYFEEFFHREEKTASIKHNSPFFFMDYLK
jgi:hypothetical protein